MSVVPELDDEEFNEWCEECGKKMTDKILTEEEYDEYPDRELGYVSVCAAEWFCPECREKSDDETDDETTYITHISDGIETDKGTKTIYTKEEYVQKGYWQSDENPDNLEFRLILLNQHSK